MPQVHHPAFPEDVREVENVDDWVASGWTKTPNQTAAPKKATARKSSARKTAAEADPAVKETADNG